MAQQREDGAPNNENDANEKNGSSDPVAAAEANHDTESEDAAQAAKRLKQEIVATEVRINDDSIREMGREILDRWMLVRF